MFDIISVDYFHLSMRALQCLLGGCIEVVEVAVAYFRFFFLVMTGSVRVFQLDVKVFKLSFNPDIH